MKIRFIVIVAVLPLLAGCMGVIGYYPTEEELEAIKRGENPRAKANQPARDGKAGDSGKSARRDGGNVEPTPPPEQTPGPVRGVVLRWVSAASVNIEAEGRLHVVVIPGVVVPQEYSAAERARMNAEDEYPYGTAVILTYPRRDAAGKTVYRDNEDRLLAKIERDKP